LTWHLYAEAGRRGVARSGEERWWRGRARAAWGKEREMMGRACMSGERRNSAEKVCSEECANGAWAD
jgi:hypothetical protein